VADVFISYSSRNRTQAASVAHALEALGLDVWWDRELVVGQAYDQIIEKQLDSSGCVVVLWSAEAVDSEWVRNEAAAGLQRGVLVPANLDGVKLPLEFRRRQTADLSAWAGDVQHEGFQSLHRAIANTLKGRPVAGTAPAASVARASKIKTLAWVGTPIALVLSLGAAYWFGSQSAKSAAVAAKPPTASSLITPQSTDASPEPDAIRLAVKPPELADMAVGEFFGDVISDAKGPSRSHITVTVERVSASRVRVSSPYARIGTHEVELTQGGSAVFHAEGDNTFSLYMTKQPYELHFNARGEVQFTGLRVR
jgi:TIR domain